MKLLRSITRRGFSVGTAGWFTVLRPNTWFPASRLPGESRRHVRHGSEAVPTLPRAENISGQNPRAPSGSYEKPISLQIAQPTLDRQRLARLAWVVLAAAVITSILLGWIIRP